MNAKNIPLMQMKVTGSNLLYQANFAKKRRQNEAGQNI